MAQRSIFLPVALIVVGAVLFVWNVGGIPPDLRETLGRWWPLVLLVIGLGLLASAAARPASRPRAIVPGVILTIYGCFFLLVPLGHLSLQDVGRYWGVFPAGVGVALLVRRWTVPGRRRSPIPAVVLLAIGALGLTGGAVPDAVRYWPLALVAAGALILWRRLR